MYCFLRNDSIFDFLIIVKALTENKWNIFFYREKNIKKILFCGRIVNELHLPGFYFSKRIEKNIAIF